MSIKPGPSLITASPMSGHVPSWTTATSPSVTVRPLPVVIGTFARSAAVSTGSECWICSRWFGVSMKPPLPITCALEKRRIPESTAFDVVSMTSSSVTPYVASRSGSTWTCGILIRSPQIATFATPGTRSKRPRIVQ